MTAEIAIFNKTAVALAADSAVTLTSPNGTKIYNTENKVFTLSKHHPVGIMIYGNANFMGVPWETIIKTYRKKLGTETFPSLEGYCKSFISFLGNEKNFLFPLVEQEKFFSDYLKLFFNEMQKEVEEKVKEATTN